VKQKLILLIKPLVEYFPGVAALYRSLRDQLDCMEMPKLTPWGFHFAGNPAMIEGTFEPVETELVRNILQEVDVLVNVGANIGYYCCHALSLGKSVIAFEPIYRNLCLLQKNINANNWDGVEIFPIALSDKAGILEIYGGDTGASILKGWADISEAYKTNVPASTMNLVLNNRLEGKRALVIVDIEGAEKLMLEGAEEILANKPKPIWLVEITAHENQPEGVKINPNYVRTFEIFLKNGYDAFKVNDVFSPIHMDEIILISTGVLQAGTHNFLFRERQSEIRSPSAA